MCLVLPQVGMLNLVESPTKGLIPSEEWMDDEKGNMEAGKRGGRRIWGWYVK